MLPLPYLFLVRLFLCSSVSSLFVSFGVQPVEKTTYILQTTEIYHKYACMRRNKVFVSLQKLWYREQLSSAFYTSPFIMSDVMVAEEHIFCSQNVRLSMASHMNIFPLHYRKINLLFIYPCYGFSLVYNLSSDCYRVASKRYLSGC